MSLRNIIVGTDHSATADDALRWACGLAAASGAAVRTLTTASNHEPGDQIGNVVEHLVRTGEPAQALVAASANADLVVIGRTGHGHHLRHVERIESELGATARRCLEQATGAVAIVPALQPWKPAPKVIVGIDGSPGARSALRWAATNLPESCTIFGLRAIPQSVEGPVAFAHRPLDQALEAADRELDHEIGAALQGLGDIVLQRVEPMVIVDDARYALIDPDFDVDIIVVGPASDASRQGDGSVADHIVRYGVCPVVVVPEY